ncbi:hypothetical protein BAUCODRAFT_78806 [Baudoinia panamericana UAMH 10762]|uniref:Protein arginine N-methyltransferase n=1 Tax=Baudoinia panamericana (strain UAMH 10762) TaxID=717646 RepID=M2LCI0_BAUPA|nr:uncharacterized protein BAUCODRAFT_78806 [Baudoinia panamericana UAMH 10762]EMC91657.1 hypothetical protein BAUCODRAFT_78806 [Baudoinia panamericana UAMH 10762]
MTLSQGGQLLPSEEAATPLYVGHHDTQRDETSPSVLLAQAQEAGYDLVTLPVTNGGFQSHVLSVIEQYVTSLTRAPEAKGVPLPLLAPLAPDHTNLSPGEGTSSLVAFASPWIDVGSPDPLIAHISRQVLNLEVAYAAFCGISNIAIRGPLNHASISQYGRAVLELLGVSPYLQIHLLLPVSGELEQDISDEHTHLAELVRPQYVKGTEMDEDDPNEYNSWDVWNTIRSMCNYNSKLSIALELPRQLPPLSLQSRWFSEPVRMLSLPRTSFIRNGKGYPVLSNALQQYLSRFLRLRFAPLLLLSNVAHLSTAGDGAASQSRIMNPTPAEAATQPAGQEDRTLHLQYMRHLQQTQPLRSPIERFGQGYQDYMQSPLQPLTDNLESITYEVFEKDPIKYEWYERAIALALKDLDARFGNQRAVIVAVVGAGRGPLVTRVLQASQKTGVAVDCWAVEKNPNAYVLLQKRNRSDPLWNNQVNLAKSDMRSWSGPPGLAGRTNTVDILVSELLGSFGDNELSPECLDGVQHVLHPVHGISIPQSYSAHLTPIATPKLHADLLSRSSLDVTSDKWELPYVVMLHQYDYLAVSPETAEEQHGPDVQEAWSFAHPAPATLLVQAQKRAGGMIDAGGGVGGDGTNEHNSRSCQLRFKCDNRGFCHGLAGYFETVLYHSSSTGQKVELSTNPVTMAEKSKDMISWFPIFFPFRTPLYVPDGAELEVSMWRQTDDRKVWYEWMAEVHEEANGKRRGLGMSELHTSRKNGCLM